MRLEEKFGANFVTYLLPCFFPRLEPASHLKRFENDSDWLIWLPVFNSCNWSESSQRVLITVKSRYNEPLYNEVPGITKCSLCSQVVCFATTVTANYMGKNLDIRNNLVYILNIFCLSLGPSIYRGCTVRGFWLHKTEIKATL